MLMSEPLQRYCPECEEVVPQENLDRRNFIRVVGGSTASLLAAGSVAPALVHADAPAANNNRPARPAEALVRELFDGMTQEQRRTLVLAYDHGAGRNNATPTRKRMYNAAINGERIGQHYTRPQQELIERILRSISSGENGFRQISRNGTWDGSREMTGCGAHIFGDPTTNQWAWVFSGHHLTVRCDGNSEPGAAFGGPIYYGHSPDGYSQRNIFHYQTRTALSVFDSLTEAQRRRAVVVGSPGEQEPSVRFRPAGEAHPGISAADLTADQRRLVDQVMREVLSPFRREDGDEVMEIVRQNGGAERIHLAFYRDRNAPAAERWHFWRLEGPGFVWNYRVLPHVHTYVNIAARPRQQRNAQG
jgi:hypothetical protein